MTDKQKETIISCADKLRFTPGLDNQDLFLTIGEVVGMLDHMILVDKIGEDIKNPIVFSDNGNDLEERMRKEANLPEPGCYDFIGAIIHSSKNGIDMKRKSGNVTIQGNWYPNSNPKIPKRILRIEDFTIEDVNAIDWYEV